MSTGAIAVLQNIVNDDPAIWIVVTVVGYFTGIIVIFGGFMYLANAAGDDNKPMLPGLVGVGIGSLLLTLTSTLSMLSYSLFNQTMSTGLSYAGTSNGQSTLYLKVVYSIVSIMGLWAVIYGMILLNRAATDKKEFGRGMTHVFGGIAAINIVVFLGFFGSFLGGTAQSVIHLLTG